MQSAREVAFGFDLGGSSLKAGLVTRDGRILMSAVAPIDRRTRLAGVRAALRAGVTRLWDAARAAKVRPSCVGAGVAGTIAGAAGRLVTPSPVMPYMRGFEIAAFLRAESGLAAVAENDATVAALAEFRLGTGRGKDSLLMVTVGTGLGGGLVVDGKIVRGRFGTAGEIGHGVFQPDGEPCGCGSRGCLEQYASSPALLRFYREAGGGGDAVVSDIVTDARAGETAAVIAVKRLGGNLGIGLATCASLVPVDVVAIGGGISVLGATLLAPVRAAFVAHALPYVRKTVRIVRAKLGNHAGLVGAALLAFAVLDAEKPRRRAR